MKAQISFGVLLLGSSLVMAQSKLPANDISLTNVQTPSLLATDKLAAALDLRYLGGYDKTLREGLWAGYGIGHNLEIDFAGDVTNWNRASFTTGDIRFGGADEEFSLRYALPYDITVQAGLAFIQTPAQHPRTAGTVGATYGYSPVKEVRLYLNPKAVFLDHNTLVGIGIGGVGDVSHNLSVFGDWTPLVAGDNTINTADLSRNRAEIWSGGLRFANLFKKACLDLGVTNSSGLSTGESLTPSLGNSPAYFARLTYKF